MTNQQKCHDVSFAVEQITNIINKIIYDNKHPLALFENPNLTKFWKAIDKAKKEIDCSCCKCPNCFVLSELYMIFNRFIKAILPIHKASNRILKIFNTYKDLNLICDDYIKTYQSDTVISEDEINAIICKYGQYENNKIVKIIHRMSKKIIDKTLNLRSNYIQYKQNNCHEAIKSAARTINLEIVDWTDCNISSGRKIVYFDQNVISDFQTDNDFKNFVQSLKDSNEYVFVYSPYSIEELLKKQNGTWQKKFMDTISELTDNMILLKDRSNNKSIVIKKELPIYSLYRAMVTRSMTEAAQQLRLLKYEEGRVILLQSQIDKINSRIGNGDFEKTILKNDPTGEFLRNLYFHCVNDEYCMGELNLSPEEEESYIYNCSNFLSLSGFKKDKDETTQKSNFFDIEHAIYARDVDFFVTKDKNLITRLSFIYKKLGKKTVVISSEDFISAIEKDNVC